MNPVLEGLAEKFEEVSWGESHGQVVARVPAEAWQPFAAAARDFGFEMCVDITAVDWLRARPRRFEVVANLVSVSQRLRLRMITDVDGETPLLSSLTSVWPGANFAEREVYDMFGITFEGHPDLTRILMPDEWEGHPLRKDFDTGSVPVQFKAAPKVT